MKAPIKKLKRLICLLICMVMIMPSIAFAGSLTDVKGHWAESQIVEWVNKGYIKSYGNGTFRPDSPITRAEFMAIVNRAFGFKDMMQSLNYKDIKKTDWFYEDVAKAVKAGYMNGSGNNILPESNITNQEVAQVISRLLKLSAPSGFDITAKFKDSASISKWSLDAVKAVASKGYMKGYNDQTFKPTRPITRAEAVAVLDDCYLKHQKKAIHRAGEYSEGTVEGSILIGARAVTLKDTVINGDLILSEEIGDGDVHLKNVTVKGETIVKGGGMNSIYIEDSNLTHITIIKVDNKVRVVAVGSSNIGAVNMQSGAKLEEQGVTGGGFGFVTIAEESADNASVILAGSFESIQLMADNVNLSLLNGTISNLNITQQGGASRVNIAAGSTISSMRLDAAVSITGSGTIQNAQVNAAGSTLGINPANITNPAGVNVTINPPAAPAAPPAVSGGSSGGGGGGGGGGSNSGGNGNNSPQPGSIAIVSDQALIENSLDDRKLTIRLTNETFNDGILSNSSFILNNAPAGLSVEGLEYVNSTTAVLNLAYDFTDFDAGINNLSVTVAGSELRQGRALTSNFIVVSANEVDDKTLPRMEEFTVLSSNSLQLVFNERLNKLSAETVDNYVLNKGIGKASEAKLEEDGMTVTIKYPYRLLKNIIYKLSIENVRDLYGNFCDEPTKIFYSPFDIPPEYMAPELTGAVVIDNMTLELTFNEQLEKTSAETLMNYSVNYGIGNPLTAVLKEDGRTVRLTLPQLEAGKQYVVYADYIADLDGNKMVNGKGYFFVYNEHDMTVPEVTAIEASSSNELKLTFDETVEVRAGSRVVVSFGNTPEYADFIWTDTVTLGNGKTVVFKANKNKALSDSLEQSGSFTGTDFLMDNTGYTIEKVIGILDVAGNIYDVDNDNEQVFVGSNAPNDKPEVVSIEQIDALTIEIVFSEPVLSPEGSLISRGELSKEFVISKADPEELMTDSGYSTIKLTSDTLLGLNTYSFDLSAVPGLTDFCGTPVKDTGDSDGNDSGYTDYTTTYEDTDGPYIEDVEAINNNTIHVIYDEPLSYPGTYQVIYYQGDYQRTVNNSAALLPGDNRTVKISTMDGLSEDIIYTLRPSAAARDLSGNLSDSAEEEWEFQGSDEVSNGYITGVALLNGKKIRVVSTAPINTAYGDTIAVYNSADTTKEDMTESISGMGTDNLTINLKTPVLEGIDYTVEVTGAVEDTYSFGGIVQDGGISVDADNIITFEDVNAVDYAVILTYDDTSHLVVPENPSSGFDASSLLSWLPVGKEYAIEVYDVVTPHAITEGSWASPYGEYSEASNPDGFVRGAILYYFETTYSDIKGPVLSEVESMNVKTIYAHFNEPMSSPGTYTLRNIDENITIECSAAVHPSDNNIVIITPAEELTGGVRYSLTPATAAEDLSGNEAVTEAGFTFWSSYMPDSEFIKGFAIICGEAIQIETTVPIDIDNGNTITVYNSADPDKENMIDSISGLGTLKLTISFKTPALDDNSYIIEINGEWEDIYSFDGFVDDEGVYVGGDGVVEFSGANALYRAVYIIFDGISHLVVPETPSSSFDASEILSALTPGEEYEIMVYSVAQSHAVEGDSWASPYGEYSEIDNPDGFMRGGLLYYSIETYSDTDYIMGVEVIGGERITVSSTAPIDTAAGDTITVYDNDDPDKVDLIESIEGMGTDTLDILLNAPIFEGNTYTVETTGEVEDIHSFEGIVGEGDISFSLDGCITFANWDATNYVVYAVYNDTPHLIVPETPNSGFDAFAITSSLTSGEELIIKVYDLIQPQETAGDVWASPYGEYSESNLDGFRKRSLIYYKKFICY